MIPIFDLDDTLYPERTFVESGFKAVASMLEQRYEWPSEESMQLMLGFLETEGRGAIFNRLLETNGLLSAAKVSECVRAYRHHSPSIKLADGARELLCTLGKRSYLVTDGHKIVQKNKVSALALEHLFNKVYITHRYGIKHAKPSAYCFGLIREREQCKWSDMVYVGDNPSKDFVTLNSLGVHTIRVMTGEHKNAIAKPLHDAKHRIGSLKELGLIIEGVFHEEKIGI